MGRKKVVKNPFSAILRQKKVPMAIKLKKEGGGGGKVLMAWPLVEKLFFLRLPLR